LETKKANLVEEIEHFEHDIEQIKEKLSKISKHMDWHDLREEDKFERLRPGRKHLMDTIKMIAFRSETAMVNIVRKKLSRKDEARSLIRDLFRSEADILPDIEAGILMVQIHSMANPRYNHAIKYLLGQINDAALNYPGTTLRLVYRMASHDFSPGSGKMGSPYFPIDQVI